MSILEQQFVNQLQKYEESRRKTNEGAYDRALHNNKIQDLIDELSQQIDLE